MVGATVIDFRDLRLRRFRRLNRPLL